MVVSFARLLLTFPILYMMFIMMYIYIVTQLSGFAILQMSPRSQLHFHE